MTDGEGQADGAAEDLRTSAKGWHGVQLAVLGFVGLCGVLKDSGPAGVPRDVQAAAGVLALSALAIACCAVVLVGTAAWPLYRAQARPPTDPRRTSRALRAGIALTFTAVVLLALSAATSWWPVSEGGATRSLVRVSAGGATVCGPLHGGGEGYLTVRVQDRAVAVPLARITAVRPVSSCG
ncbi:hypothetical protein [Streptomyces sp. UG1]|uniref:hypothetical protein n=1 Tax=Streptomyces sp. UG1 TaxID=3417652 RepID=UPI003CFB3ABA